jgi:hypothetical protein
MPESTSHERRSRADEASRAADEAAPDLGRSVAGVVEAVLDVGVSVTKVLAEATAPGGVVEPLPPSTPAFQAIVRYGVTAVGNVATAILSGGQVLRRAAGVTVGAAAAGAPVPPASSPATARGGPRVQPGSTLRVPLSVENPGERPMRELTPRVRALRHADGRDAAGVIPPGAVRFDPEEFDVAPRDFEKLTVFIAVPAQAPVGAFELVLALGPDEPDLKIAFAIAAPAAA